MPSSSSSSSSHFLLFLSLLTLCISTTTVAATTTATLDVASAVQKTIDLLNPTNSLILTQQQTDDQPIINVTSSSLSFTLHPRSSIHHHHHHDYESLTLARLARDSHRVTSLVSKLHISISNISNMIIKPADHEGDLSTPVSSGISQGSGEYFARVGLGTPMQSYYMVVDTGSDINWIQCRPCKECYQQTDPLFNPAESSSFNALTCRSHQCQSVDITTCRDHKCVYQVSYGDGSFTVGNFVTETVSFGRSRYVPDIALGCGYDNEGLFVGAAGLLGLGGGAMSLPSQLRARSFSYCLVHRDTRTASTLEFNSAAPGDSVIAAPLLRNPRMKTYLYVGLVGMSVSGRPVVVPPSVFTLDGSSGRGGVIVDSGTSVTRLQSRAYASLRDAFVKRARSLTQTTTGFSLFDTCFDLSGTRRVAVPTVAFNFAGGKTLTLKPENYLIPVDSHGKFCFAFAPTTTSLSIIGNVQQQGIRVGYDFTKSLVTFSPDNC